MTKENIILIAEQICLLQNKQQDKQLKVNEVSISLSTTYFRKESRFV